MNSKLKTLAVAVFLIIALGLYFLLTPVGPEPLDNDPTQDVVSLLSTEELKRLVELRNLGVAYLENHQWQESAELFQEMLETLPESLLALTNLALAQTESLQNMDTNAGRGELNQAIQVTLATTSRLKKAAPQDPVSYRLEARVATKQQQVERGVELLQQAAELAPDDPTIWYEIFQLSQASRDPETGAVGQAALQRLHELAPQNIFAFLQWMTVSAQSPDAPLDQIVKEFEELIVPLAAGIEKRSRYNVLPFLERVKLSLAEGNLAAARSGLMPLKNVITPDPVAQSDLKRLEQNSLEFVALEFAPNVEQRLRELEADTGKQESEIRFRVRQALAPLDQSVSQLELVDLNLDGHLDLVVLTESSLRVLGQTADQSAWEEFFSLPVETGFSQFVLADLDYDRQDPSNVSAGPAGSGHTTDLDLILFGTAGLKLIKTNLSAVGGDVSLEVVEATADVSVLRDVLRVIPADLNNDGDLDLAVVSGGRLLALNNRGNFDFAGATFDAQLAEQIVVDCVALDWDRDIDIDLLVLLADGTVGQMESHRHGTFRWQPFPQASSVNDPRTLEILDLDRNGSWDLLIGGDGGIELFSTRILENGLVKVVAAQLLSNEPTQQLRHFDFDNDGWRDILSLSEDGITLFDGKKLLAEEVVESGELVVTPAASAFAVGDIDEDGAPDLLVPSLASIDSFMNEGGRGKPWIDVALLAAHVEDQGAVNSQRINYYGYGSTIELRAGTQFQQLFVRSPTTRFGLGSQPVADAVRVIWTNGIPQNVIRPEANQRVWEVQKLTGSCPYLYAWNGESFEFVTDLLWAAPLGLQSPTGDLVPCRPWEYLKIPGESLREKNGNYVLQITEELWETAYFDQVELIAIDHPEEFEIYSNEKVGPPPIAEYKIHQVRSRQQPVAVTSQSGEDLLDEVRAEDQIFAKAFRHKITQGYTDDSYVEIDFGLTEKPEKLTLFLTGWMHPTDTGLNVAIHENPKLSGPRPPSILAPNAAGEFIEVIPYCGFPGGKTKTIAIDLTDCFPADDYRIRIATSLELYWDHIFFSTDDLPQELVSQSLTCSAADLHFRGVSAIEYGDHNGPEKFHYHDSHTVPPWPHIEGNFTRYGDVLELVSNVDHQLVVMGAGDEMTLEFDLPLHPLKPGWKRDFILHCVGWDKDANLHTITGERVEPLPFVDMPTYPFAATLPLPHPADYQRKYQTRRMHPHLFRSVFRRSLIEELEAVDTRPSH